jgi:uncharacterized protein (TIGR03435 family)
MRNKDLGIDDALERGFTQHGEPSHEQMAADLARIRERLDPAVARATVPSALRRKSHALSLVSSAFRRKPVQFAAAAVLVVAAAIATAILWRPADTALYRIVEGDVRVNGTIRSNGGGGAVLALSDGSRVEMRSHTELSFERADDGLRIRLNAGGIIVNAAKQRTGHLYVQTKDMTVSVVGTVFVVNADEDGSRVAVIEGEVNVQQGATEKKLRTGDQVATSLSLLPSLPLGEDIAWSRNAEAHRALLQQSRVVPTATARQIVGEPTFTFEVASVRPSEPLPEGMRSGPYVGCTGGPLQLDARRFAAMNKTLFHLITIAYGARGRGCSVYSSNELLSGGPAWIRSDQFDVEALIPEGVPQYTARQLADGNAPHLQAMLQELLAKRFNLVLRREMKDMPVYMLVAGREGANRSVKAGDRWIGRDTGLPGFVLDPERRGVSIEAKSPGLLVLWGRRASMADLAAALISLTGTGRQVLDRTGFSGEFNFDVDGFASSIYDYRGAPPPRSIFSALDEELGLKLEASREKVEALVIDHAEKPSHN